jgi:hypothetical protein
MKKIIFFLAIVSPILFACNPLKPGKEAVPTKFKAADSIPRVTAKNWINHYLDANVDHNPDAIIKQISLFNSDLFEIFKIENITRIKLLIAAYPSDDPIKERQNKPTVLVQLKQGYHSNYYYYDIQSLDANKEVPDDDRLCPLPPNCGPQIED